MSTGTVRFAVPGTPVPQGSKRAFVVNGRAVMTEAAGARHKSWRREVADAARDAAGGQQFTGPVWARITFTFPWPKADPARTRHAIRPDIDKLVRAVFDALTTSGVIKDDAQVWGMNVDKLYGTEPGVLVRIYDDDPMEQRDRTARKAQAKELKRKAKIALGLIA